MHFEPILDNYAALNHTNVGQWLDRYERFAFHFTQMSCSGLNAVEGFFAKFTKRQLKCNVFNSLVDLPAAINRFFDEQNANLTPITCTADPNRIIAAVKRRHQALVLDH